MSKRKTKFNIMDAIILVVLLAVVAVLLYVFVFSESGEAALGETDTYTLTYVVEVTKLSEEYADRVKVGAAVVDSSKKLPIGTVVAVEKHPHQHLGTNYTEGEMSLTTVDGYSDLYVTLEASATLSGITYSVGGFEVRVGNKVYLAFSDLVCEGYCISLTAAQ